MKIARICVLLSLCCTLSFSTTLLKTSFKTQNNYVDILLDFDEAFNGKIRQQNANGATFLFFDNLSVNDASSNDINSTILENISIANIDKSLKFHIKSQNKLKISATKSEDSLNMRVRISNATLDFSAINTQKSNDLDSRYISVIVVLGVLCVILLIIKRMIMLKQKKLNAKKALENLIESKVEKKPVNDENNKANFDLFSPNNANDVKVLFEKHLDEQNKLMLLNYENRKYLVLVGSSNVMLDRFGEDQISNQNDFDAFFEENKQKLNKYLATRQNSLNDYKNKLDLN